jgi:hypothetical protein
MREKENIIFRPKRWTLRNGISSYQLDISG